MAVGYLLLAPSSPDLAAASYRSDLFSRVGFTLWDNSWYGGHHLPAYSLSPRHWARWIGPQLVVALAVVCRTALFDAAARDGAGRARGHEGRVAVVRVGRPSIGCSPIRVPFDLGLALGLGCCWRHAGAAAGSARAGVLCSLASPVAGAFLALALLAWALTCAATARAAVAAALTAGALVPIGLLALLSRKGAHSRLSARPSARRRSACF